MGGSLDNESVRFIEPIRLHRRQLHALQPKKGVRREYGGTRSLGLKRGALVENKKYKICYVGGTSNNKISLHDIKTGKRLCQNTKTQECKFLTYLTWKTNSSPC